ncbi:MAG TPA: transketolase [Verrucomicrobiales bacterium]|nr:transketolase [Verrucomicrobiales bacterium]|tara:strand:+ start:156 stop:2216 length:2061 start_codon:yes stop_codon:yes gene_type:complete
MGADNTPVDSVEAPPLKPISIPSRLADTPSQDPKYSLTVNDSGGQSVTLADPNATRAAVALMNVHAVVGGAACHWGGPAAFAEIMAATHGIMFAAEGRQWHEAFNFINDAGHTENGVYALRANYGFDGLTYESLRGFRSIESKLTGHGESHLNPEGILISNGPLGSGLPQAQGLAIGDKFAGNDRVTICTISDGAMMEGEAKESVAAIPGLAAKGHVNPFVLILSDNDTKLSGRITHDSFSMQPSFEAIDDLGWNVIQVEDGHDLQAVYTAIEKGIAEAKANHNKPVCLWVKTIKGKGIIATEENSAGGHGFPLKNAEKIIDWVHEIYGSSEAPEEFLTWAKELNEAWKQAEEAKASAEPSATPAIEKSKVQAGLAKGAIRAAQEGAPVFSISSDVQGSTGVSAFQKAVAGRFIEVGIAEANMVSTGAGMSKVGFVPIVDTFGQFGVTKGNLPLTMAALSQGPVIAMFSHVGFQDAADGASHQATTYLAAVSAIPHTTVIVPSCPDEAEEFMYQAIKRFEADRSAGKDGESYIFFVGRENYPLSWVENPSYQWGKAQVLQEGGEIVLVGSGVLLNRVIEAGKQLAQEGVKATVINNPFINHVDIETLGEAVKAASGRLVTIEDHQVIGGMGAQLSHGLSNAGISHCIKTLGIAGEFGQSAYKADQLYDKFGLNVEGVVSAAKELLG